MSTFTQKRLAGALTNTASQLTTSAAQLYAPGANTVTIIKQIVICNTSTSSTTCSFWVLPTGQTTSDDAFAFIKDLSVEAKETIFLNTNIVLANTNGDKLYASAGVGTAITALVNGIEETP